MFVTRFEERYIESASNAEVKAYLKPPTGLPLNITAHLWPWKQETTNVFKQRLSDGMLVKTVDKSIQKLLRRPDVQDIVILITRTQLTDTNAKYLTTSDETLGKWTEYVLTQGHM